MSCKYNIQLTGSHSLDIIIIISNIYRNDMHNINGGPGHDLDREI